MKGLVHNNKGNHGIFGRGIKGLATPPIHTTEFKSLENMAVQKMLFLAIWFNLAIQQ